MSTLGSSSASLSTSMPVPTTLPSCPVPDTSAEDSVLIRAPYIGLEGRESRDLSVHGTIDWMGAGGRQHDKVKVRRAQIIQHK